MQNKTLANDYLKRAGHRLVAIDVLYTLTSWADVVRESQEVVELALKALLRFGSIEPPRLHDVSEVLSQQKSCFAESVQKHIGKMCEISRSLRRDRELAFYGTEDLTPSEFYKKEDADKAKEQARWIVERVNEAFKSKG